MSVTIERFIEQLHQATIDAKQGRISDARIKFHFDVLGRSYTYLAELFDSGSEGPIGSNPEWELHLYDGLTTDESDRIRSATFFIETNDEQHAREWGMAEIQRHLRPATSDLENGDAPEFAQVHAFDLHAIGQSELPIE